MVVGASLLRNRGSPAGLSTPGVPTNFLGLNTSDDPLEEMTMRRFHAVPPVGLLLLIVLQVGTPALAMEYGLVLQTTDRDFARFSGLQWENPLVSEVG